jgi:hypothetical protein
MPTELLTYQALADRLGVSPEAARGLAKRLHLPRRPSNDGKALVSVDLSEIQHKPKPVKSARLPADNPPDFAFKAKLEMLQAEVSRLEGVAAGNRADYERERDRGDRLEAELGAAWQKINDMVAESMVAELASLAHRMAEQEAYRSRPWWHRLVG